MVVRLDWLVHWLGQ